MGGAPASAGGVVLPGEKVWRLLQDDWYPKDASGQRTAILEVAFIGQVSLLRTSLIDQNIVDGFPHGRFANHGIVEMDADEIVSRLDAHSNSTIAMPIGPPTRMWCSDVAPAERA